MGNYIYVRMVHLPDAIRAVTLPNDDGSFDIYINNALPELLQNRALEHELRHINMNHFYNEDPVTQNENEAG